MLNFENVTTKENFIKYIKENKMKLEEAEKAGRKIKADRLLKQFLQLAILVNNYANFGFLD